VLVISMAWFWAAGYLLPYRGLDQEENFHPDELSMAMLNLDRTMRMVDATEDWPAWARWLMLGWRDRSEALHDFREGLEDFGDPKEWSHDYSGVPAALDAALQGNPVPQPVQPQAKLGKWWHLQAHSAAGDSLLVRYCMGLAAVWVIALAGLCLLPATWRRYRLAWPIQRALRRRRLIWRWPLALTLGLFLVSNLAGDLWFDGLLDFYGEDGPGELASIGMDFMWRAIPPLVVVILVFRRSRHAVSVFGLQPQVDWRLILAAFGCTLLFDTVYATALTEVIPYDVTGGLDPMEAGRLGLFYGLLSACVAAPLFEEFLYRGLLLRGFERRAGVLGALLLSSVIFAVVHDYDVFGLISVGVFGAVAGIVYLASGSLTNAILLHTLHNLSITLPMWWVYHAGY
jgi:membrane protease YdiL (CAAX protease family)